MREYTKEDIDEEGYGDGEIFTTNDNNNNNKIRFYIIY